MPPSPVITAKIKVALKLSIARLRMVQRRDEALAKEQRRSMAQLLDVGKEESARIRVENIIRSDIISELHEVLELYCELLLARAGLLEGPTCDPGLEEAVNSIIYAAPKTEIKELQQIRNFMAEKFGKEFVLQATDNSHGKVSEKVVKKLTVTPPRPELVQGYLEEIAKAYGVSWPKVSKEELGSPPDYSDIGGDDGPGGGQARKSVEASLAARDRDAEAQEELIKATPPKAFEPSSPLHVNPPSPSTDNIRPKVTYRSLELTPSKKMTNGSLARKSPGAKGDVNARVPDDDDLSKRFAALKR